MKVGERCIVTAMDWRVVPLPVSEWPKRRQLDRALRAHRPVVSRGLSLVAMYEQERMRLKKEARSKPKA